MNSRGSGLMNSRRSILESIRRHLAASAPFDAVASERHGHGEPPAEPPVAAPAPEPAGALAEQFRQALEAVSGRCTLVRDEAEAAAVVERILEGAKARRVGVSSAPLVRRVIGRVKSEAVFLEDAPASALFECEVGVTGAQWAAAETGTLVLESDRERHRLASLVPPAHVAILEAGRIRRTLGEVLRTLEEEGREGLSRAVTFITGPSRTSDIELTLAIGVHGPAELHVVILEGEAR